MGMYPFSDLKKLFWFETRIRRMLWRVYFCEPFQGYFDFATAVCDPSTRHILVSVDTPRKDLARVLVHEFLHATIYSSGCHILREEDLVGGIDVEMANVMGTMGFKTPNLPVGFLSFKRDLAGNV